MDKIVQAYSSQKFFLLKIQDLMKDYLDIVFDHNIDRLEREPTHLMTFYHELSKKSLVCSVCAVAVLLKFTSFSYFGLN